MIPRELHITIDQFVSGAVLGSRTRITELERELYRERHSLKLALELRKALPPVPPLEP